MKDCKVMGIFVPKCSQNTERIENFTFQAFVKKANHLARFDDYDHQNRNFTVSIMVVSIIL